MKKNKITEKDFLATPCVKSFMNEISKFTEKGYRVINESNLTGYNLYDMLLEYNLYNLDNYAKLYLKASKYLDRVDDEE